MKFDNDQVSMSLEEEKKIGDALEALAKDPHAPRELSVRLTIHIHNEYPKHITVGVDKDGVAITKIVGTADEEKSVLASNAPAATA